LLAEEEEGKRGKGGEEKFQGAPSIHFILVIRT